MRIYLPGTSATAAAAVDGPEPLLAAEGAAQEEMNAIADEAEAMFLLRDEAHAAAEDAEARLREVQTTARAEATDAARVNSAELARFANEAKEARDDAAAKIAAKERELAASIAAANAPRGNADVNGSAFERMMADDGNVFAGMSVFERYTNEIGRAHV